MFHWIAEKDVLFFMWAICSKTLQKGETLTTNTEDDSTGEFSISFGLSSLKGVSLPGPSHQNILKNSHIWGSLEF